MSKQNKKSNRKVKYNKYQLFYLKNNLLLKTSIIVISIIVFCFGIIHYIVNHPGISYLGKQLINISFDEIEITKPKLETKDNYCYVTADIQDEGYNYYAPTKGSFGYRYGPTILINDDGSLDAWFSSPGNNRTEWDWIAYAHSDDGINWSEEKIVLQPTGDSMDHYSVCDPGVIYFNGHYYLGYTSTITSTNEGINNNVYLARSKKPDGPYEKWNGNGWGGKPKPIIYYDEADSSWGAGEISFVIVDGTLYCYYSWYCEHGFYNHVSTANLSDDWPNSLTYQGISYSNKNGQDSSDVVYLDEYNKFLAFSVSDRFCDNSGLLILESDDGINFKKSDIIRTNMSMYAHNLGISKHLDGHINMDDNLCIGYAYGSSANSKGKWATRIQPIELITYENDSKIERDKDGHPTFRNAYNNSKKSYISGISAVKRTINLKENKKETIKLYSYSQTRATSLINKGISYEYDKDIISITGNTIKAKKEGTTVVYAYYDDFYTTFTVNVNNSNDKEIIRFEPVEETIYLYIENENYHTKQIRGYVEFDNGDWGESYNDYTNDHPRYPAMIDGNKYHMQYEVEDKEICYVDDKGIIYPKRKGQTKIKVTINDDCYFYVNVIVDF